jgi:GNAT superfamily N-acetyltransferase
MNFEIRRATVDDIETLVEFNQAMAFETEGKSLTAATLTRGVRAVFDSPGKGWYLIAIHNGVRAGSLLITPEWSDWRNADYWWIQSVYVSPEYRGKGVYTALHRRVEELARHEDGVCGLRLYVDSDNEVARTVYKNLGLVPSRYDLYEIDKPSKNE